MIILLVLAGYLAAASRPGLGQAPGQEAVEPAWPEDSDTALEDLEAAGQPPIREELVDPADTTISHSRTPWGFVSMRGGYRQGVGDDLTGRLLLESGSWRVKARWRRSVEGASDQAAALSWRTSRQSLVVGRLGFRHGFGLLVAGPGRTPSLSADKSLRLGRSGPVAWTGYPDDRTLLGAGAALAWRRWRIHILAGSPEKAGAIGQPPTTLVRVERSGEGSALGLGVLEHEGRRAFGVSGRVGSGSLAGEGEGCLRRGAGDGLVRWTGMTVLRWRPERSTFIEAGWAAADGGGDWVPGTSPVLVPGWSGRGYVVRGGTRTPGGTKVRFLFHQGVARPSPGGEDRERRRLLDLQADRRVGEGWRFLARVRRTSWTRWEQQERHPWLPALPVTTRLQTVLSLNLVHDDGAWRRSLLLRTLGQETPGREGRRSLLSVSVRGRVGRDWTLRAFLTSAWGDDVDLVTAVVPLSGVVVARHWGKWRSETGGGLGKRMGGLEIQVAAGYRRAEPGRGERDETWARISLAGRW